MIKYGIELPEDAEEVKAIETSVLSKSFVIGTIEDAMANFFEGLKSCCFDGDDLDGAQYEYIDDEFKITLINENLDNIEYASFDLKIENIKFFRAEEKPEEEWSEKDKRDLRADIAVSKAKDDKFPIEIDFDDEHGGYK